MKSSTSNHKPTQDQIAQRAYAIFEQNGRAPGRDLENWMQAERELSASNGHKPESAKETKSNGQAKSSERATTTHADTSNRSQSRLEKK